MFFCFFLPVHKMPFNIHTVVIYFCGLHACQFICIIVLIMYLFQVLFTWCLNTWTMT